MNSSTGRPIRAATQASHRSGYAAQRTSVEAFIIVRNEDGTPVEPPPRTRKKAAPRASPAAAITQQPVSPQPEPQASPSPQPTPSPPSPPTGGTGPSDIGHIPSTVTTTKYTASLLFVDGHSGSTLIFEDTFQLQVESLIVSRIFAQWVQRRKELRDHLTNLSALNRFNVVVCPCLTAQQMLTFGKLARPQLRGCVRVRTLRSTATGPHPRVVVDLHDVLQTARACIPESDDIDLFILFAIEDDASACLGKTEPELDDQELDDQELDDQDPYSAWHDMDFGLGSPHVGVTALSEPQVISAGLQDDTASSSFALCLDAASFEILKPKELTHSMINILFSGAVACLKSASNAEGYTKQLRKMQSVHMIASALSIPTDPREKNWAVVHTADVGLERYTSSLKDIANWAKIESFSTYKQQYGYVGGAMEVRKQLRRLRHWDPNTPLSPDLAASMGVVDALVNGYPAVHRQSLVGFKVRAMPHITAAFDRLPSIGVFVNTNDPWELQERARSIWEV